MGVAQCITKKLARASLFYFFKNSCPTPTDAGARLSSLCLGALVAQTRVATKTLRRNGFDLWLQRVGLDPGQP